MAAMYNSCTKLPMDRFIEYGGQGGNYYGTSLDSVRKVLVESKVCLLDVEPHVSGRTSVCALNGLTVHVGRKLGIIPEMLIKGLVQTC